VYCAHCGTQIPGDAAFCHACGAPTGASLPPAVSSAQESRPYAAPRVAERVPAWVLEYLMEGESVIASRPAGNVNYVATDRRLLRFTSRSHCVSAPYTDVSLTLQRYGWGWRLFCLLVVIFGLVVAGIGVIALLDPDAPRAVVIVLFAGVALTLWMGLVGRFGYYQICVWNPENGGIDKWRIERLRWSPKNASMDRLAAAVSEGSKVFGGNRPELYPRPRPRFVAGDPGLKLLPVVLTSVPSIGIIWLIGNSGGDVWTKAGDIYDIRGDVLLLGFVVLPVAAGFAAGLLASWRGATHGALAGMLVAGGALACVMYREFVEVKELTEPTDLGFLFPYLGPFVSGALAAGAGFVGEKLRR